MKIKQRLNAIIDVYLYHSFHIGLCAAAITAFSYISLSKSLNYSYLLFIFFGTMCIYNMHRIIGIKKYKNKRVVNRYEKVKYYERSLSFLIVISTISAIILSLKVFSNLNIYSIIPFFIAGGLSILYVTPILPNRLRLRDFHFIKIFIISITWSILTCTIPLIQSGLSTKTIAFLSIERLLFILAITIPFDIRDLELEELNKLMTIPSFIGVFKSKVIALTLLSITLLINSYYASFFIIDFVALCSLIISYFIAAILIIRSSIYRSDHFFIGLIDGTILLPLVIFGILNLI